VNNIGDETPVTANESIAFAAETRIATAYLSNRLIKPGTVSLTAQFDDGIGGTVDVIVTDNSGGELQVTGTKVGSIDYDSGKLTLSLPDATYQTGLSMIGLWASAYTYQVAASSNKAWAGFVKVSDLSGKGFYVLDMSGPTTRDSYWSFTILIFSIIQMSMALV